VSATSAQRAIPTTVSWDCGFVLIGRLASQYCIEFGVHQSDGKERLPCC
jgi:hypothetical protein